MFDSHLLLDEKVFANFSTLFNKELNCNEIPQYLKESRMVLLSKTGQEEVKLSDIRLIAVTSHLKKVIE